jgi:hypothetical protein
MKARDLLALAIGMALYRIATHVDDRRALAKVQFRALVERMRAKRKVTS